MKIIIAPDSFKESLTAMQVAEAIEQGFSEIFPQAEYIKLPMADGGEGTVESMVAATGGELVNVEVTGPLGVPVKAFYGWMGDGETAVIEMAAASGLHLVAPEQRNPLITTSYGTGELILAALNHGARKIILGIGGSATNDGGAGMMQALGVQLSDQQGKALTVGGAALVQLVDIDLSQLDDRLAQTDILVACDVDNPLCGAKGASAVFGPQKGATPERVQQLDAALQHYGEKIEQVTGKSVINVAGAGAAGGMGAALFGLLNARLQPGIEIVTEALKLAAAVQEADLVITGEGRIDSQTIHGKTPVGVARVAKRFDIPVIAIAGSMAPDYEVVHQHGLDAVFSVLNHIQTLPEALEEASDNIRITARNVAAVWKMGRS
ncbi:MULTISPECIES: glycerate kinase [Yersinia pseudotuberculosis complex]|uniref:Glycerate kinase n=1 Tax=Yersinia pseudotuberculosis serotype O:1b (strain IP 31758) TaxID=349747 RepID=A0A0U1QZT7_YERP3|nr:MULTISPECIES: glycerate kinase [Yersinia pseudotuberculosis complex]ABS48333.1 glycerate kinase [Yersinia pseudotuberculosis IP 31758]AJK15990.1 glycerate kinase family protein [Yersinia pseudotuberculosis str. PA3606]MCE4112685.1 glycerate kinase [Yersinia pseudotuberculosis]MCF1163525.1 glycerate kinase [Yersinia pseudotuberculosis]RYC25835.1 glycerate kinase [Yersinia pseudotuberculosis]